MKNKIILSEIIKPDSNVINGGGKDSTLLIQNILNKANSKGLYLYVDGAYLCGTLEIKSNTTIECANSDCGFFLKDGVSDALFRNSKCLIKGEKDYNIKFIGGTYNLNCKGQEHHRPFPEGVEADTTKAYEYMSFGFRFYGVENFIMRDLNIRNQRTYSMAFCDFKHVTIENIFIDLPDIMYGQNQDGMHFFGPGRFLTLRNIRGCSGDDFIALASDELDGVSDLTDVVIDGLHLDDADQGIRLLSRGKGKLDRIIIRNVTGTYKSYGFFINPWVIRDYEPNSFGNYGSITIENVDLYQEGKKYDYTKPFLFRIGGIFESIVLKNINFRNKDDSSDFMQIGADYTVFENNSSDLKTEIQNLILDTVQISQGEKVKTKGVINKGVINNLLVSNIISDVKFWLNKGGTVKNEKIISIIEKELR